MENCYSLSQSCVRKHPSSAETACGASSLVETEDELVRKELASRAEKKMRDVGNGVKVTSERQSEKDFKDDK